MKIFLLGASGMIGSRILAEAVARGHQVVAGARNPARIAAAKGVTAVAVDANDEAALTALAVEADVIVTALAPRSTGDAMTEAATAATAVMAAAAASGKRLVMVGGAGSLTLPDGSPVLPHVPEIYRAEAAALKAVRDRLAASTLDWTFFSPAGVIAPGERTGVFRVGGSVLLSDAAGESRISAEDYAVAMVDELETPAHRRGMMTVAY